MTRQQTATVNAPDTRVDSPDMSERGSAIIEFLALGIIILIPVMYLIITLFTIQSAIFAAEGAARDAARIIAAGRDEAAAFDVANAAVSIAMSDVPGHDGASLSFDCDASPCLTSGSTVRTAVTTHVPLPLLPDAIAPSITIEGTAVAVVDQWVDR